MGDDGKYFKVTHGDGTESVFGWCPAWADGMHCFRDDGPSRRGMMTDPMSAMVDPRPPKRCACGAEVKRT